MNKIDFKGSVVLNPVPVVMVSCRSNEGKDNVFTVAWTGTINTKPPMLSISIRPERLSFEYIKETMEFCVNLPNINLMNATDFCGVRSGKEVDKIKEMNFTMVEGINVNVPYIDECPINIECKVKEIIPLGTHHLFLAEVVGSHINSNLIDESGKIHFEWANLINYCHGEYFPMSKEAIGKFGISVAKNKDLIKKYSKNYKKTINKKDYIVSSKNFKKEKNNENTKKNFNKDKLKKTYTKSKNR
ncbi:flavin reductase family protein [Clostridium tarantellae]|uniref:Flavin reductase family protein n=1 Tax=Clostridium tarantellae TaxID=39493 RepID=A0A6I1MKY2_9CLOT|nr:flavin reductase family protein [Clostridium tarantellae]MPQ43393.1 flavin reductase family protein [Clostridium tarantellae]